MKKKLIALSVLGALSTQAQAFEFDTGDSDWSVRWDNTFKYNLAIRAEKQDKDIITAPGSTGYVQIDPDLSFDRGDIISNRLDLLSELDVIWNDTLGFRVSAAAWYDYAYEGDMNQPGSISPHWTNPSVGVGELSDRADELHHKYAEILDAFVFANFDIGDIAMNIRAGRHTIYWGQSLFLQGAIASAGAAMNQVDGVKAFSVPGSEVKELFMPTNKISTVVQFTDQLTLEAYYSLEWEPFRIPEATTYFSPVDALTEDAEAIHLAVIPAAASPFDYDTGIGLRSNDFEGGDDEWGVNFSYYFENSGLEVGAYYINYADKILQGLVGAIDATKALSAGIFDGPLSGAGYSPEQISAIKAIFGSDPFSDPFNPNRPEVGGYAIGSWTYVFKDDIDLFGITLSKELWGISFGLDITTRRNAPLRFDFGGSIQRFYNIPEVFQPLLGSREVPLDKKGRINIDSGEIKHWTPTGDTYGLVLNGLGLLTDNGIWEGGSYAVELTFAYLDKIHNLENLRLQYTETNGVQIDEDDLYSNIQVKFNPTWYQVWPGTDLTLRTAVGMGINNSSPINFGGDEEVGSGAVGLEFLINQTWTVSGSYNFFFGPWQNHTAGRWKDRDNVSFTIKRTF